jgi:hypothetical protein
MSHFNFGPVGEGKTLPFVDSMAQEAGFATWESFPVIISDGDNKEVVTQIIGYDSNGEPCGTIRVPKLAYEAAGPAFAVVVPPPGPNRQTRRSKKYKK